jgi:co-chaperonin GroES (HSP10)
MALNIKPLSDRVLIEPVAAETAGIFCGKNLDSWKWN